MSDIKIVEGGVFSDYRGKISHVNELNMDDIKRFYVIHHNSIEVVRAWHAHQFEKKWFYCLRGSFTLALVKIDNWESPSLELTPEVFHLSADDSKIICIPEGYANGLKAETEDSIMLVYSNKVLDEAVKDSWRYDANMWMNW